MEIGYSPAPGESRTTIIVWEIDDPSKKGDPRYWWVAKDTERLRRLSQDCPDLTGRPKGESLASLRSRAEGDVVELVHPALSDSPAEDRRVRVPLSQWRDADPERTYLFIAHQRRPTADEQDAIKARGMPWPDGVEALRQEWLAKEAAGDNEEAARARQRFDEALRPLGFRKARDISAWNPARAAELRPGVFVQDERPSAKA